MKTNSTRVTLQKKELDIIINALISIADLRPDPDPLHPNPRGTPVLRVIRKLITSYDRDNEFEDPYNLIAVCPAEDLAYAAWKADHHA